MKLKKLDETNKHLNLSTFGIPFKKGEVTKEDLEKLAVLNNKIPIKSFIYPTAFWPDGTIKWTGVNTICNNLEKLEIKKGKRKKGNLEISQTKDILKVKTSKLNIKFDKLTSNIVDNISNRKTNENIVQGQKLVAKLTNDDFCKIANFKVIVENSNDVRACIKCSSDIVYKEDVLFKNDTRIYIYDDSKEIKYVTTMFVANDNTKYIIKDLGITTEYNINSQDEFNRYVKFTLEAGAYTEPFMTLASRAYRENNKEYEKQLKGIYVDLENIDSKMLELAKTNATWHDFLLTHSDSYTYRLTKKTGQSFQEVQIDQGIRSLGGLQLGNGNSSMTIVPKDFWQKYPSAIEVNNLGESNVAATYWINHNKEMIFTHYSKKHHFNCYEGFEMLRSCAIGTANTSEFYIKFNDTFESNNDFYEYTQDKQKPSIYITDEEIYRTSEAVGVYGKYQDDLSSNKVLENCIDEMLDFYDLEVEQRNWYGYWNYGDFMHTFDNHRGQWWYDFGGYAWQNTELNPNMWLWYSFFRKLDNQSYNLAYNMTRHNSDTDVYHFGKYKGLGSRHNVLHYGCSCKEDRISMAHLYRLFYYLHVDERVGEMMDMVVDEAPNTLKSVGPYDQFYERVDGFTHMRIGPDWASLCSNWLVKYERTLDEKYLNYILKGIKSIEKFKYNIFEGPEVLMNNETYELRSIGAGLSNGYHMTISFGAPQVWWDMINTLELTEFSSYLSEFGIHYFRTKLEMENLYDSKMTKDKFHWPEFAIGLLGYSAYYDKDLNVINQAKGVLFEYMAEDKHLFHRRCITRHKNLIEYDNISTNVVAQWCLNTICVLGFEEKINNN